MIINAKNHLTVRKIHNSDNNIHSWGLMYEGEINKEYLKESYHSEYCQGNKVYLLKCPDINGLQHVDLIQHIPNDVLKALKNEELMFALDCSSEADFSMVDTVYSEIVDKLSIKPSQVLLIATSKDLKNYMVSLGRDPINIECFDFFERLMQRQMRFVLSPTEKVPKLNSPLLGSKFNKKYMCLNRMSRSHRLALLRIMSKKNLVDDGYYSFPLEPDTQQKLDSVDSLFPSLLDLMDTIDNTFSKLPLNVDTDKILEINHAYSPQRDLLKFYRNSYFSIVSETYFFKGNPKFFTEKIFKPIIHKHPFILLSTPNMLQHLREYGYKTFDGIIDESYDTIENDDERFLAVVNEIERLCNLSESELKTFREQCIEIVDYNFNHIMNKINFVSRL